MATIPEVQEWPGARLENGEHLAYAKAIVGILHDLDHDKVKIGTPLAALDTLNQKQTDFINESKGYASTAQIAALDDRRDAIFRAMWDFASAAAKLEGDDAFASAANTFRTFIAAYKGLDRHKLAQETEEIYGLKHDLEKSESLTRAVAALKLETWFAQLFNINESFLNAYQSRNDESIARLAEKDGNTTESLRKEAAALVCTLVRRVNYTLEFNPSAEATAAANALAAIIAQYKTVAASRKHEKKEDPDAAATASQG